MLGQGGMKILVIEDDQSLANLLKIALTQKGHEVLIYSDPTACPVYIDHASLCARETPCADVIISDYILPNMSGLDFYKIQRGRGCKALDQNKALITGSAITDEIKKDMEELGCHFIKKPFTIAEVIQWVDTCEKRLD